MDTAKSRRENAPRPPFSAHLEKASRDARSISGRGEENDLLCSPDMGVFRSHSPQLFPMVVLMNTVTLQFNTNWHYSEFLRKWDSFWSMRRPERRADNTLVWVHVPFSKLEALKRDINEAFKESQGFWTFEGDESEPSGWHDNYTWDEAVKKFETKEEE